MPTQKERRQETRARMLDAASREFRSHGFAGVGVDAIAKSAGATSGAFYAHLGSKDGAFKAALEVGLDEVIKGVPIYQKESGEKWVEAFAKYYLGKDHRMNTASGCAMTTLSPEVSRSDPDIQAIYERKMKIIVDLIAHGLAGASMSDKRQRAWSIISTLIGGLTAARAVESDQVAEEISNSITKSVVIVAGGTRAIPDARD